MKNSYSFPLINHRAIQSIVNRQVKENYAVPLAEMNTESLVSEERLSSMNCFPELPVGGKCTRHREFKIDLSLIGSTVNHITQKYCDGIQSACENKKVSLQDTMKQKSPELRPNEECIVKRSDSAFNAKFFSMDENFLSLENEILEEHELSYVSHVVEKTIRDMTLESEIECELPDRNKGMLSQESVLLNIGSRELCLEKDSQLDSTKLSFQVTSSVNNHNVQLNYADAHTVLSGSHSIKRETTMKDASYEFEGNDIPIMPKELEHFPEKLNRTSTHSLDQKKEINVPQKDFVRETAGIHTLEHEKEFLANMDRKIEQSQEKKTRSHILSSSPISQSHISPALKVLRKRSESHIIAYDTYNPCNALIQQGPLQACSPLASKSQETTDLWIDLKEVESISERGFGIGNTSGSIKHLEIKSKKLSKRRKKVNLTAPNQTLKKNEISLCIVPKMPKKELLNWKDWQCLQEAGTSWKSGVRRSSRIKSRPLEFWRGERFLYGRVLNCLSTVIGIKYTSPESVATGRDKTTSFKIESFVDEKFSDAVNFAALY